MRTVDDAARCIEKLNGLSLHGRNIRVDYSATQKPHSSTPGQYMGAKRPVRKSSLSHMNCNAILSSYRAGDDRYGRGRYDDRRGGYGDRRHDDRVIITVQVAADTTIEMAATGKSAFVARQAHPLINFFYS